MTEVLVQVHYRRRRYVWERTTALYDPGHPYHFPTDRTRVLSTWVQLPHVSLRGLRLYAATIYFRAVEPEEAQEWEETGRTRPWDPDEQLKKEIGDGWVFGAVDYFRVVNP